MKRLTNAEFDRISRICDNDGIPIDQCPTCGTTRSEREDGLEGKYSYLRETHYCDCNRQIDLRIHYLLANIGDQYQRLNWDTDFKGAKKVREAVKTVLDNWKACKTSGVGIEFSSINLGVGKTFAATYVARQLVQAGERVYFAPFLEIVSELCDPNSVLEETLKDITILVLDEVIEGTSFAQQALFATKFEELIRHRTNFNKVTIMTTNLTPQQLREAYPRPYSLLEPKQIRVEMAGNDFRQSGLIMDNLSMIASAEVRPIS